MPGACNKFDADGIALLANAIRLNSELTSLDVKSSGIGDVGTALLSEALKFNDALTTLNLDNNNIGSNGAAALADKRNSVYL